MVLKSDTIGCMNNIDALIQTLKGELKRQKITYRSLAERMGISEATVKRDFSKGQFSMQRLAAMCEVLDMSFLELAERAERQNQVITQLNAKQEAALVADPLLLLTTYLIINHWSADDIMNTYRIDENMLISHLLALHELGIIEYRPPWRIKKRTARNFAWRREGPVHDFFMQQVLPDFINNTFAAEHEAFHFQGGLLSEESQHKLSQSLNKLAQEFDALVQQDSRLPRDKRNGSGMLLAMRPWEYHVFTDLRHHS